MKFKNEAMPIFNLSLHLFFESKSSDLLIMSNRQCQLAVCYVASCTLCILEHLSVLKNLLESILYLQSLKLLISGFLFKMYIPIFKFPKE